MAVSPSPLVLASPAKVNLMLRVVGRRPDGFHELETLMQTISLADRITIERLSQGGIELTADVDWVPRGEENLVWRGAELFFRHTGVTGGVRIHLHKKIPAGGGLGGGSSNLATTLKGMDRLWQTFLGVDELRNLAATLGSAPACRVRGGTAICRGRGEIITPLAPAPDLHYILLIPPFPSSTPGVFQALDPGNYSQKEKFSAGLVNINDSQQVPDSWVFNDLERAAFRARPEFVALERELAENGLAGFRLSGSGSTLFRVYRDQEAARQGYAQAQKALGGSESVLLLARSLEMGDR